VATWGATLGAEWEEESVDSQNVESTISDWFTTRDKQDYIKQRDRQTIDRSVGRSAYDKLTGGRVGGNVGGKVGGRV